METGPGWWINSVRPQARPQTHNKKQNIGAAPFRYIYPGTLLHSLHEYLDGGVH